MTWMSSDERLAHLGLLHLKDRPTELAQALQELIGTQKQDAAAWDQELLRRFEAERAELAKKAAVLAKTKKER